MMLLNCLNKTSLTPPLVIEVPVSSQESRWYWICVQGVSILLFSTIFLLDFGTVPTTGICFIQIIYAPSSSLLQGKYLPFSPSLLRLNSFHLFVILSLTQLYRYTLEIFLFSTATFKYTYRAPSDELDKKIQRTSLRLLFSHWNGYSHFRFALDFSYAFGIL